MSRLEEETHRISNTATCSTRNTLQLLDGVQKLVELERSLTEAMEMAELWLPGGNARPLPTMETVTTNNNNIVNNNNNVQKILAVARNLASRTSAPVGWNPHAPVIGFTTPNPMPHQLRGGALGALQLIMARKEQQQIRKEKMERKREREEAMIISSTTTAAAAKAQQSMLQSSLSNKNANDAGDNDGDANNPNNNNNHPMSAKRPALQQARQASAGTRQGAQPQRPRQPAIVADMNLSDDDDDDDTSSSDEE